MVTPSSCGTSSPKTRKRLSPREYQTRTELCRVWDLMQQGVRPSDIASIMGKDPARVSRLISRVQEDFHTIFPKPSEDDAICEHLALLNVSLKKAMRAAEEETGMARIGAMKTAAALLRDRCAFMQFTGRISKNADSEPFHLPNAYRGAFGD